MNVRARPWTWLLLAASAACGSSGAHSAPDGGPDGGAPDGGALDGGGQEVGVRYRAIASTEAVSAFVQGDETSFYFHPGPALPTDDIFRLPRAGGTATRLVTGTPDAAPEPFRVGGGRLGYVTGGTIHVLELATGTDTTQAVTGVEDLALGDDGVYWVAATPDGQAITTVIRRRLWTATTAETLFTGTLGFASRLTANAGQVLGFEQTGQGTGQLWVLAAGSQQPKELEFVAGVPVNRGLAVDAQFIYFTTLDAATQVARVPRTGGAVQLLAAAAGFVADDVLLYGRQVVWIADGRLFALEKSGGAPIDLGPTSCAAPFVVGQALFCVDSAGGLSEVTLGGLAAF